MTFQESKWAEAFPVKHHDAETIAGLLVEQVSVFADRPRPRCRRAVDAGCLWAPRDWKAQN